MNDKFFRVYKPFDVKTIKEHLLIHGDLTSSCANCGEIDLKLDMKTCPKCSTTFTFISFRNIKNHLPKLLKIHNERQDVTVIDYEDFHRQSGARKAEEFFK